MQLIQSQQLTMSSREIADLLSVRHDSVKRTIERLAKPKVDDEGVPVQPPAIQLPPLVEVKNHLSQTVLEYLVCKRDSYVVVAQLSPEFTAKLVDRWQELESQQAPKLPTTYRDALVALIAAEDAKEQALLERDTAVATKAEIGSRREATAMNTASQAVKKASTLEQQLDRSKEYCTVKRMSMIHHGQPFDWRTLKAASAEMGINPVDVFDQNYGTVKAYHADVWREVYGLEI